MKVHSSMVFCLIPQCSIFNPDPACLSNITSSADWLEKNFAEFSFYATLKDLQTLNINFSSVSNLWN